MVGIPKATDIRAETHLERLLELDPTLWTHPSQVLERPFSDLADLLGASCRRLETAAGDERRRLASVEEKLAQAVRIEDGARKRRAERDGAG